MGRTCAALFLALWTCTALAQQSSDEGAVWKLEHSYWETVKTQDIAGYRALWHEDFYGWPYLSAKPLRKNHIADWLDQYSVNGMRLKSYSLKPAGTTAGGDIVVTYYWLTAVWEDKTGPRPPETQRITHEWIRVPTGWQILGGMSARAIENHK